MSKSPVRAKFRCLEITEKTTWRGSVVAVKLCPVQAEHVEWRDGRTYKSEHPENKLFWDASPSGECAFTFPSMSEVEAAGFEVGAYYYIDLLDPSEMPEGVTPGWYSAYTHSVLFHYGHQIEFKAYASRHDMWLTIGVQNPGAIPRLVGPFLELHAQNREEFSKDRWAGNVSRADFWAIHFHRAEVKETVEG